MQRPDVCRDPVKRFLAGTTCQPFMPSPPPPNRSESPRDLRAAALASSPGIPPPERRCLNISHPMSAVTSKPRVMNTAMALTFRRLERTAVPRICQVVSGYASTGPAAIRYGGTGSPSALASVGCPRNQSADKHAKRWLPITRRSSPSSSHTLPLRSTASATVTSTHSTSIACCFNTPVLPESSGSTATWATSRSPHATCTGRRRLIGGNAEPRRSGESTCVISPPMTVKPWGHRDSPLHSRYSPLSPRRATASNGLPRAERDEKNGKDASRR